MRNFVRCTVKEWCIKHLSSLIERSFKDDDKTFMLLSVDASIRKGTVTAKCECTATKKVVEFTARHAAVAINGKGCKSAAIACLAVHGFNYPLDILGLKFKRLRGRIPTGYVQFDGVRWHPLYTKPEWTKNHGELRGNLRRSAGLYFC